MIDFACKRFEIKEIIKCSLGCTKSDCKILQYLIEHEEEYYTTEELARKNGLDLTTVQRSVKKLNEKSVVKRRQENLSGGGYVFKYQAEDKRKIREEISDIVMTWARKVKEELQKW